VRILTRYLVARFLGTFVAFLIVSTITIVIVEMMLNLGDMLQRERGLRGITSYLFLRIPSYYLRDLLPVVAFAAAFFTLGSASRSRELQAMKAGGVSPRRAAAPLLWVGIFLTAGTFLVNETLVLEATRLWNQRDTQANPITFRQGSFWYQRGRTIYNIGDADRTTRTLRGVHVYELGEHGRLLRSVEAERATVRDDDQWLFHAPLVRRFDAANSERPPVTTRHEGDVALDLDGGSAVALSADVTTLTVAELREVIEQQQRGGHEASRTRAVLHARLAEPFCVLLFVVAAIPLGVRVERRGAQGMTVAALYGLAILAAFFALRSVADALASGGLLPPSPVPWVVLAAFSAFVAWRYAEMPG
jgi:LPS export ABC transporter permease LptG